MENLTDPEDKKKVLKVLKKKKKPKSRSLRVSKKQFMEAYIQSLKERIEKEAPPRGVCLSQKPCFFPISQNI